jgi:23S rRNA pseudouridine2605 synthase
MKVRLQKILARAGVASRRGAEELIRSGRVLVNGKILGELGARADPIADEIRVDGERVPHPSHLFYLMGYKPTGVLTSMGDPQGRPTIRSLWPTLPKGAFPVGRLDFNSSGLLLLTNDGSLAQDLLHPRFKVSKRYRVKVRGFPDERSLTRLRQGVNLKDGMTAPADVRILQSLEKKLWLDVRITEGRFHQVRRMCEAVRLSVEKLVRTEFGPLKLGRLRPGEIRLLTLLEITELKKLK